MVSQKSFGIYFNNDLRPRFTRATLPIQPIHVQPEEHLGVDQCEPFRGRHADEALLQCLRRHRPLVAHLHPIRQLRVFEPLAAFDPIPLLAMHAGRVEKSLWCSTSHFYEWTASSQLRRGGRCVLEASPAALPRLHGNPEPERLLYVTVL